MITFGSNPGEALQLPLLLEGSYYCKELKRGNTLLHKLATNSSVNGDLLVQAVPECWERPKNGFSWISRTGCGQNLHEALPVYLRTSPISDDEALQHEDSVFPMRRLFNSHAILHGTAITTKTSRT